MDGRAGQLALVLSLAWTPALLPLFSLLSHRFRRLLTRPLPVGVLSPFVSLAILAKQAKSLYSA